ncbi:MAG: O-antigen translocase [Verrucomicrobiota bacterium]
MSVQDGAGLAPAAPGKSYGQVLKSSALIGGATVINSGLGIVRQKAMALLLGPAGFGLMGIYLSISEMTRSVAGMGINSSGVRQIAEAVGTGDSKRIARTIIALRRVAFATGALGSLLLVAFAKPVSRLTFGDDTHATSVALMALAVFFMDISAAQVALIQGMRRVADLARVNVLGALFGTVLSIPIVYLFYRQGRAEQGVVPALVCVAAMSILTSWWYARKIQVERVTVPLRELWAEAGELLKLGFVFMATGLMTLCIPYAVRVMILRTIGPEGTGFYQAAWILSGTYVGFILAAMGADFYPRLTAVASRHDECNRLVNEQAEVGLLMAGPGLLATLTFAPLVIQLFYSDKFGPSVEILRWNCIGMLLQVASWPMGFIIIAKGARAVFFWTELASCAVHIGLVWLLIHGFQLAGVGMAFAAFYALHWILVYVIARRMTGFCWSPQSLRIFAVLAPVFAVVFGAWYVLPPYAAFGIGALATVLTGVYALRTICSLVPFERLPRPAQKGLRLLRMAPRP